MREIAGFLWAIAVSGEALAQAFPINTNVALQPAEGQSVYRAQFRHRQFANAAGVDVTTSVVSNVIVYGWTSRLSSVVGLPLIHREVDRESGDDNSVGVGDINLIARYQLWKRLAFLESRSWTALAGVQAPSKDDPFSSGSWNIVIGTVYSWRQRRNGADVDAVYRMNTENEAGTKAGNRLFYDFVYQYRVSPGEYSSSTRRTLTGLVEVNGEYAQEVELHGETLQETDGHQVFLGPGVVLSGVRGRLELGIQIPIVRSGGHNSEDDDFRLVAGFTVAR